MLSKSLFDLDHSNAPIIKAQILSSPDVRDKIAKRFIEELGHLSKWCCIQPISETDYMISPIGPHELMVHAEDMLKAALEYEARISQVTASVGITK